jgi:hypothetical protein
VGRAAVEGGADAEVAFDDDDASDEDDGRGMCDIAGEGP